MSVGDTYRVIALNLTKFWEGWSSLIFWHILQGPLWSNHFRPDKIWVITGPWNSSRPLPKPVYSHFLMSLLGSGTTITVSLRGMTVFPSPSPSIFSPRYYSIRYKASLVLYRIWSDKRNPGFPSWQTLRHKYLCYSCYCHVPPFYPRLFFFRECIGLQSSCRWPCNVKINIGFKYAIPVLK